MSSTVLRNSPDRCAGKRAKASSPKAMLRSAVPVLALLCGGCGAESSLGARAFVTPGKFIGKTCPELAALHASTSARITELSQLMDKAAREPSGRVIGPAVYGGTLAEARGERRIIEEAQTEMKCAEQAPAPPPGR